MSGREFDLVLYGATGFVGALTAEYLARAAPAGTRIALAGRSPEKLDALLHTLGDGASAWRTIVADAGSPADLAAMAERTRVVVTTVGPYARYGLPLVEACAKAGTHYADLTGEPLFVRECADRFHEVAATSGAKIVNSCGFDSVPSDLNAYLLHRRLADDDAGRMTGTTLVAALKGGMSGGTVDSGITQMAAVAADRSLGRVLADPYALSPDRGREPDLGAQKDHALRRATDVVPGMPGWVTTFIMAAHNTRIVRRSAALLDWAYGREFQYREVMWTGKSPAAPVVAAGVAVALAAFQAGGPLVARGPGLRLLRRIAPEPGTGPDAKARANGHFTMTTVTRSTTGARYRAVFAAQGDPGYQATAVMLGESGLALALDEERLPATAGVLTPATAMADALTGRLRAADFTITTERLDA
ncbi:saccharopine dehydrogenase family protein [Streptomyces sp. CO7]